MSVLLRRNTRFTTELNMLAVMEDVKKRAGELIREARKAKGLTQQELGVLLGVNVSVINRYERGNQNLTVETLGKVLEILGKSLVIDYK